MAVRVRVMMNAIRIAEKQRQRVIQTSKTILKRFVDKGVQNVPAMPISITKGFRIITKDVSGFLGILVRRHTSPLKSRVDAYLVAPLGPPRLLRRLAGTKTDAGEGHVDVRMVRSKSLDYEIDCWKFFPVVSSLSAAESGAYFGDPAKLKGGMFRD